MRYTIRLSRMARSYLRRLDPAMTARIAHLFDELCENPFESRHSKLLAGTSGLRSARVGSLRVLFDVDDDDDEHLILVQEIGPRGQIYRRVNGRS